MNKYLQNTLCTALAAVFLSAPFCGMPVIAEEEAVMAQDISASTKVTGSGFEGFSFLTDKITANYKKSNGNVTVNLENEAGIASLYLMFNLEYGPYTLSDENGKEMTAGQYGFLHEYLDLEAGFGHIPTKVTISFDKGSVYISEIFAFSKGETPDFVQKWAPPLDQGADLVLFTTHGDDDQLFFAGLLPYYAAEMGYRVQAVYLTDHRNLTFTRTHEILNGLWAVGVHAYPVMGSFSDFRIDDLKESYAAYKWEGVTEEMLQSFVVEQVRRFKPQVAVGHDIAGEYGHGMHMVYTDLLIKALDLAADENAFPELAEKYGTWDIPKTYLHLYDQNQIVMDWDVPLESFNGMTAFEVTQKLGYPCHQSQQYTWFTGWINGKNGNVITKASQIATYNPCYYGLYRTLVGEDINKNDFFENLISYDEQERIAREEEEKRLEEERQREEEEKRRQEEEERQKAEEEAKRQEEERLEKERLEKEKEEKERLEREEAERREESENAKDPATREEQKLEAKKQAITATAVVVVVILIAVFVLLLARSRKKR